jgi:hypothetical protein
VRLLANELKFVQPGELLAAIEGRAAWPHSVFELYWPLARADSFEPARPGSFEPVPQPVAA